MIWEKLEQSKLIVGGKSMFLFAPIKFVMPNKHPIRDVEKALILSLEFWGDWEISVIK